MLLQVFSIARNAFVEAIRQPIFFVLLLICGLLQVFLTWSTGFSMGYTDTAEVSADNKFLLDMGLATVFVCGMLLAAFLATAVVSREIENKTVLTVVSKPIPRPLLIIGKFIGVAGTILIAVVLMVLFLLMAIRHGVMSNASDDLDGPVLLFTFLALGLALGVALWTNFFYGWYFTQTSVIVMLPAMLVAYGLVLLINKEWHWQPPTVDLKPQIMFACAAVAMALLVLTSLATAVSTRLGQVMTIVVCAGSFLFGLLTNQALGRHVFDNSHVARVKAAAPLGDTKTPLTTPGDTYAVAFQVPPKRAIKPGDSFYYSAAPNGFPMAVGSFPAFTGDLSKDTAILGAPAPGLVITEVQPEGVTVRRAGSGSLRVDRAPTPDDYVFLSPTRANVPALVAWSVLPNFHDFWLVDAVSQNQRIPEAHMLKVALYALGYVVAFLALGVALFQTRDVG
ncbi:MAG: ABC transporter permease [Phycisphaerae bacterium]|nr:ABC transporter permease [Phycisphaerae bacterium]